MPDRKDLSDYDIPDDFDIALLSRTAGRVAAASPLSEALDEVVKFVTQVVNCDSCMVYVLEKDELVLRASRNPHPEVVGRLKMKLGQGITGWVAQNRHPVVLGERAYEDFRFKLFNELPEDRYEAFLSVPIVSGGRLVGVINVQSRAAYRYTKREISMIATLGFLAGSEIQMARLESENAELATKLENRTAVERAKSILQRNLKIGEDEAYRTLQSESQKRRKSMREIAEAVILGDEMGSAPRREPGSEPRSSEQAEFKSGPSKV